MNPWDQFVDLFAEGLTRLAEFLSFLGGHQWAAAIVLLTLFIRLLVMPLAVKQIKSMRAMQRLQPEMKRLQGKYKKDKQRLNQELMELYNREGVNPLGGCLPIVAQFPILIAMFYALRNLTDVARNVAEQGLLWVATVSGETVGVARAAFESVRNTGAFGSPPNLGAARDTFQALARRCPDPSTLEGASDSAIARACDIVPEMPFLGIGDLGDAAITSAAGIVLVVIMTAAQFFQTRQMSAAQSAQQNKIMQLMPFMFLVFFINFPAALVLYWTTSTLFQLAQQTIMMRSPELRPVAKDEKGARAGKAGAKGGGAKSRGPKGGNAKGGKPRSKRSSKKSKSRRKRKR